MTRRLFRLGGCSLVVAAAVVLVNETRALRSPASQLANASASHGIDLSDAARVIEIAVQEPLNPLRNETVLLKLQNRTGGDLNLSRVRAASCGCLNFSAEKLTISADGTQVLRVEVALGDRNGVHRFAIELGSDERGTWRIELLVRALPVLRVSDPVLVAKSGGSGASVQQSIPFSISAVAEAELPRNIAVVKSPSWLHARVSMGTGLAVGDLLSKNGVILIQGEWPPSASEQATIEVNDQTCNKSVNQKITLCRLGE